LVLNWRGGTDQHHGCWAGLATRARGVVDDAIIDVENIVANAPAAERAAGSPEPALRVVLNASLEVRSAVVFASLIVRMLVLPAVFSARGLAGSFLQAAGPELCPRRC